MNKKPQKVSIKDVARDAGVGVGTVSRAINNAGNIRPETKQKIMESIRKLGYTPNSLAQSMRSQKYRNVAFFADISNVMFATIAAGICQQLETHGYALSLCNIGTTNVLEKVKAFMSGRKFDGIIISTPREDDEPLNRYLAGIDAPVVTLDRTIPGVAVGIMTDYYSSVKKATRYLLSLGHRGIALVCGPADILPTRSSINGFREVFGESGISMDRTLMFQDDHLDDFGARTMLSLMPLVSAGEITAILCLNNKIFHGILQVMRDNNLTYPDHVSLITVEDYELTQLLVPPVTVIKRPLLEMGAKVSQILLQYIQNRDLYGKLPPYTIATEFIVRESCKAIQLEP